MPAFKSSPFGRPEEGNRSKRPADSPAPFQAGVGQSGSLLTPREKGVGLSEKRVGLFRKRVGLFRKRVGLFSERVRSIPPRVPQGDFRAGKSAKSDKKGCTQVLLGSREPLFRESAFPHTPLYRGVTSRDAIPPPRRQVPPELPNRKFRPDQTPL